MTRIEEIAGEYTDHQISRAYPELDNTNLPRSSKMNLNIFDGYDIEFAVEFGMKTVLQKIEFAICLCSSEHVIPGAVRQCIENLKYNQDNGETGKDQTI